LLQKCSYNNTHCSFCNSMASLTQVAEVLRCIARSEDALTVTQVSEQLGVHKSTLSRLLRAMRDAGFLDQADGTRGYGPGSLWHEMAASVHTGESFSARASATVRRLCDDLGHTGFVSVRSGATVVGVVHHVGGNPIQVGVPIGKPLDVDACATGRAMLADMEDTWVRDLLHDKVSRASPQSPQSMDELLQRLDQIRACGFAESTNEVGNGVGALAVAARDSRSGQHLALCVTFASAVVTSRERKRAIELLGQARQQLQSPYQLPDSTP
jgi:DNA-binding IclR family transcriptional regulator